MKKFTKLFLSCAIVSVVAAASATMAFADGEAPATYEIKPATGSTLAGTYTVSSNDVTLNGVTPDANTQVTFLVYKQGSDATTVAADDVIGIDQFASGETGATSVQPTNKGLKANSVVVPAEDQNTYNVKVGYYESGTFKTASATFVTGEASVTSVDVVVGDTNGDAKLNPTDQTQLARKIAKLDQAPKNLPAGNAGKEATIASDSTVTTESGKFVVGDTNGDAKLNPTDQTQLARKIAKLDQAPKNLPAGNAGLTAKVEPTDWTPTETE